MPRRIGEEERQSARVVGGQPSGLGLWRAISALLVVADALGIASSSRLDLARQSPSEWQGIYDTQH